MNILVVTDSRFFDQRLALEIGRLAANTWANITLIDTLFAFKGKTSNDFQPNLLNYRQAILDFFPVENSCPYGPKNIDTWLKDKDGTSLISPESAPKRLTLTCIQKDVIREIYLFSKRQSLDLLLLGGNMTLKPLLVAAATEASGSVLVVKGPPDPQQIICCLNHEHVTQTSLEMINQLVTIYDAGLKIIGFSNGEDERIKIELILKRLLHYYTNLKLTPWLEMVDLSIMSQFIIQQSKNNLIAFWVDKKSSPKSLFTEDKIMSLIFGSSSSVLLLH